MTSTFPSKKKKKMTSTLAPFHNFFKITNKKGLPTYLIVG